MAKTRADGRKLEDLVSIGPAMRRDFRKLGVKSVDDLARRTPEALYDRLGRITRRRPDPCVLDTFRAAVAQARDPDLPIEYCVWWFWTRVRKGEVSGPSR
jgi:Pathogenicity locus